MVNKKLLIAVLVLVAIGIAQAGTNSHGATFNKTGRLSLTAMEKEPAAGRKAPTAAELAELRAAVTKNTNDRMKRFYLVKGLIRAGKLKQALAAAKEWREKDAYNLIVVRMLGDIYTELGQPKKALRAYSAVVELLPKDVRAQRALASVLKQSGKVDAAYQRLTVASQLRPDDLRITFELADVAHRLGKLDEAQKLFETIVTSPKASSAVRYPAKQRVAQIYSAKRRIASKASNVAQAKKLEAKIAKLAIKGGTKNDIKVYLTWDTDRSDVDLWVVNPVGEKVFYSHKQGRFGGALYDDVTTGYGPESFTARKARRGTYYVKVNYYSVGQSNFSEARGEVVVVLNEGTDKEKRHVLPYRLFQKRQTVTVARIRVK